MAKRRMLQWMRDRLENHAEKVVIPAVERKALDAAYKRAAPLVVAVVAKKYPPADMKVLQKYNAGAQHDTTKLQFPNGVVTQFEFDKDAGPYTARASYDDRIFLADAATAAAVEKWEAARDAYKIERKRRMDAYKALIAGAATIEDIIAVWPEVSGVLPAGSPPIPLGPEQIALVKADLRERIRDAA